MFIWSFCAGSRFAVCFVFIYRGLLPGRIIRECYGAVRLHGRHHGAVRLGSRLIWRHCVRIRSLRMPIANKIPLSVCKSVSVCLSVSVYLSLFGLSLSLSLSISFSLSLLLSLPLSAPLSIHSPLPTISLSSLSPSLSFSGSLK